MNMSPKVRPLWMRLLLMFGTSLLWAYKALHLPRFILPRDIKSVVNNWTHEMFWVLMKSRFTEACIDQPCYLSREGVGEVHAGPDIHRTSEYAEGKG